MWGLKVTMCTQHLAQSLARHICSISATCDLSLRSWHCLAGAGATKLRAGAPWAQDPELGACTGWCWSLRWPECDETGSVSVNGMLWLEVTGNLPKCLKQIGVDFWHMTGIPGVGSCWSCLSCLTAAPRVSSSFCPTTLPVMALDLIFYFHGLRMTTPAPGIMCL